MRIRSLLVALVLFFAAIDASAQSAAPGYGGFWKFPRQVGIFELLPYYPDRLGVLRNEIYARYGRAFTTDAYREYFQTQSWYRVDPDYTDDWLSANDRANAQFILSLEKPALSAEEARSAILRRLEYTSGDAILTFVSGNSVLWTDPNVDFGMYALNGYNVEKLSWTALGDWVLVYQYNSNQGEYSVIAYRLDHVTTKILDSALASISESDFNALLKRLAATGQP